MKRMLPLLVAAAALAAGCKSSSSSKKGEKTITELTHDLHSESAATRLGAAKELGKRGNSAIHATEMLQTVADSDPDPKVRAAAQKAIDDIVGRIEDW